MDKETMTTGGNRRRVQVRKARKDGFSAAKRQIFLDHLTAWRPLHSPQFRVDVV